MRAVCRSVSEPSTAFLRCGGDTARPTGPNAPFGRRWRDAPTRRHSATRSRQAGRMWLVARTGCGLFGCGGEMSQQRHRADAWQARRKKNMSMDLAALTAHRSWRIGADGRRDIEQRRGLDRMLLSLAGHAALCSSCLFLVVDVARPSPGRRPGNGRTRPRRAAIEAIRPALSRRYCVRHPSTPLCSASSRRQ